MASRLKRSFAMLEGVRPYTAGEHEAAGLGRAATTIAAPVHSVLGCNFMTLVLGHG